MVACVAGHGGNAAPSEALYRGRGSGAQRLCGVCKGDVVFL